MAASTRFASSYYFFYTLNEPNQHISIYHLNKSIEKPIGMYSFFSKQKKQKITSVNGRKILLDIKKILMPYKRESFFKGKRFRDIIRMCGINK